MERKMKVWMVVMATWLCSLSIHTVESASKACPKKATINGDNNFTLSYNTVSLKIDDATAETYSIFLGNLRVEVRSDEVSYDIPLLCEKSKVVKGMEYVLVDLTYNKVTITLAIYVVDLYFVAYKAGSKSYFFQDFLSLKSVLFPGTTQVDLPFTGSYTNLPDRKNVDLGKYPLGEAVLALSKYEDQGKVKTGVVVIIQMVSEAARFSLIQRTVKTNFDQRFRPLCDIITYENEWGKLSNAIQKSTDGTFPAIPLEKADGAARPVTKVTQVKQDIALLKYKTDKLAEEDTIFALLDQQEWLPMI